MLEPKTIKRAIGPILVINFFTGMGCFQRKGKRCARNWIELAYPHLFWMIFHCNKFLMTSLIIAASIKAQKLRTVITLVEACDQRMEEMGMPKRYRTLYKLQLYMFGILAFIVSVTMVISYWWQLSFTAPLAVKLFLGFTLTLPVVLIGISNVSFLFWVRYTGMKFRQLNGLLRSMLSTTPEASMHKRVMKLIRDLDRKKFRNECIRATNANANTMRAVKQIHLELIKISRTMNDVYGIQILLTMFTSLLLITCLLYVAYRTIWLPLPTDRFLEEMGPLVIWLLIHMSKIFIINSECTKTSAEAADTGDLICELYEPSTTKEFRAEIRHFTLQMIQNPLVFTACGFFDIDHTLIQGVVGTITTYLVILIQVGDMKVDHERPTFNTTSNATITSVTVD
ncbi:putative gustatory receptor 28a isoform X2 [Ptiloglossa arizonensis]|uniref:putative gustatory receptor 28a isoform X2 n=1 Tax=Ptiloglossa arizonensis TaxID=3350558 RepID=UPI003F9F047C